MSSSPISSSTTLPSSSSEVGSHKRKEDDRVKAATKQTLAPPPTPSRNRTKLERPLAPPPTPRVARIPTQSTVSETGSRKRKEDDRVKAATNRTLAPPPTPSRNRTKLERPLAPPPTRRPGEKRELFEGENQPFTQEEWTSNDGFEWGGSPLMSPLSDQAPSTPPPPDSRKRKLELKCPDAPRKRPPARGALFGNQRTAPQQEVEVDCPFLQNGAAIKEGIERVIGGAPSATITILGYQTIKITEAKKFEKGETADVYLVKGEALPYREGKRVELPEGVTQFVLKIPKIEGGRGRNGSIEERLENEKEQDDFWRGKLKDSTFARWVTHYEPKTKKLIDGYGCYLLEYVPKLIEKADIEDLKQLFDFLFDHRTMGGDFKSDNMGVDDKGKIVIFDGTHPENEEFEVAIIPAIKSFKHLTLKEKQRVFASYKNLLTTLHPESPITQQLWSKV